ncbi:Putative six-hairpin glycosidase superfamily, alpha-L-fucosidase [Septoria linicola]|uniref:Six-hairpin glycosidase superfamily, alpha-L-fucosidase n=1 Tax=Septoria linicola TaxID=215465 RepID=A0A9Q9EQR9_9PEZI|nr:Putative six-hairpin glycosidase superfamily, alpha-L-fucosidase [Septoria linicola]
MRALCLSVLLPTCLAKSLWSRQPANSSDIIRTAYPVGNGKVALLPFGQAGSEKLNINRDSLWSGGPFENASYAGGNAGDRSQYLSGIRDWIWQNGTGNVSKLMGDNNNYGSYAVLGNLSISIEGVNATTEYHRSLDLATGEHVTKYNSGAANYTVTTYCSHPDDVCVYDVASNKDLPSVNLSFENTLANASLIKTSCKRDRVQLRGVTQADIGMNYLAAATVVGQHSKTRCDDSVLQVVRTPKNRRITIVMAAGTDYDQTAGNAEHNYSFRGEDPASYVQSTIDRAAAKDASQLSSTHLSDYSSLANAFTLTLPDTRKSASVETADLVARYNSNNTAGDPYLELLSFDYARHLFISSSRQGSLPPNLQGKWATGLSNAWGADYHANINLQMNHWGIDHIGLGELQSPLWDYMLNTWVPRGTETAKLLYNASGGWVTHNEMNIFGHTGMKSGALSDEIWANYPISAAWMMQHVWDYFEYSQNTTWLREKGYPLLKGVSQFWLSQLQEDQYFKDGTLVVNPCTSAEHGPTTFGCTHYQQLIHQLFVTALQASTIIREPDTTFTTSLTSSLQTLDKGLHIGSWGQIQEWKLDIDVKNDTHRHLSELIGWYPGYSLSSYASGYTNSTIRSAVATTLYSRGLGIEDANAGWEKVWRAAAWARLDNAEKAYEELRLTIGENWASNLLSMYSGREAPFQIDANFGFGGAVLSMLVVDLPTPLQEEEEGMGQKGVRTAVLGPAIPKAWANGSVKGLRLRGGGVVDFRWDGDGVVTEAVLRGQQTAVSIVNRDGRVLAQHV